MTDTMISASDTSLVATTICFPVPERTLGAGGTPSPWQNAGLFTNSRSMTINDLTPGTTYAFQVRAVGGSTGYTDWSDPVAHMCP